MSGKGAGVFTQILRRTHAGTALMGAAIADQQLQDALLTKMRKLSRSRQSDIFNGYGPLSSFSAKIDLAFALELIDATTYKRLTAVRQIRNKFAHSADFGLTFDSPEVFAMLRGLPAADCQASDGQGLYMWHLLQVESHLVSTAGPAILKPSSPQPSRT